MSDLLTLVFQWFAQATGNVRMHLAIAEESNNNNNKNGAVYAEFSMCWYIKVSVFCCRSADSLSTAYLCVQRLYSC